MNYLIVPSAVIIDNIYFEPSNTPSSNPCNIPRLFNLSSNINLSSSTTATAPGRITGVG